MVIQLTEMIEKYGAIIIFFPVFLAASVSLSLHFRR
jgi:hypothetical protein